MAGGSLAEDEPGS